MVWEGIGSRVGMGRVNIMGSDNINKWMVWEGSITPRVEGDSLTRGNSRHIILVETRRSRC